MNSLPEPTAPRSTERPNGGIQPGRYYGRSIPYLPINGYPGKLIAVEGTDSVGRTHADSAAAEWLEVKGYGVVETGWTRSPLMQPTIELAKSSNTLNKLTFVLLYATDFADRLEKEIIPALKAGFVVLTDRYIFTALARAGVRGVDRAWLRNLYGFAIAPHLVFYLKIDVDTLIGRVLSRAGWTSGNRAWTSSTATTSTTASARTREAAARIRLDGRRIPLQRRRRPPVHQHRSRTSCGGRCRRFWNSSKGPRGPRVQGSSGSEGSQDPEVREVRDVPEVRSDATL